MADIKTSWADDDDLPSTQIIDNEDGTKTIISYKYNEQNKKVKITQKVKEVKLTEKVHPNIAKRKKWAKFGLEKDSAPGPDFRTTQLGEPVFLRLGRDWKKIEDEEQQKAKEEQAKSSAKRSIICRTCGGEHFTSKCPYKDQLGDSDKAIAGVDTNDALISDPSAVGGGAGGVDAGKSGYVPPHMRKKLMNAGLEDENAKKEEVSSTLRFSQLNTSVEEDELHDMLRAFSSYIDRLTIARDRETRRSRGFAFVEFSDPAIAQQCLERFDGKGYRSLILRVEFSKRRQN